MLSGKQEKQRLESSWIEIFVAKLISQSWEKQVILWGSMNKLWDVGRGVPQIYTKVSKMWLKNF